MRPVIMVLNGPNLNLLGTREPEVYGRETLDGIAAMLTERADALGVAVDVRQSNHEGHLIDWLHEAGRRAGGASDGAGHGSVVAVVLNPGGFTHTSVSLRDAVAAIAVPVVEVHLSNPHARESFRHRSFVSPVAAGVVQGFGAYGYRLALDAAVRLGQGRG